MKETFAQKSFRENRKRLLALFLAVVAVSIVSFLYALSDISNFRIPNILVGVITLTLFSMMLILGKWVSDRIDRYSDELSQSIENSKRGIEGEELAKEEILKTIGTDHKAFFNKELPTGGDVDCLIVGKKGIILVEVKNFSKKLILPSAWIFGFNDPRQEARKHARRLKEYLVSRGFFYNVPIHKAILYINPDVSYSGKQDIFNILGLERFPAYFESRPIDPKLTESDIAKLSRFIEDLM